MKPQQFIDLKLGKVPLSSMSATSGQIVDVGNGHVVMKTNSGWRSLSNGFSITDTTTTLSATPTELSSIIDGNTNEIVTVTCSTGGTINISADSSTYDPPVGTEILFLRATTGVNRLILLDPSGVTLNGSTVNAYVLPYYNFTLIKTGTNAWQANMFLLPISQNVSVGGYPEMVLGQAGETLALNDIVYAKDDGGAFYQWFKADASAEATSSGRLGLVLSGLGTITPGDNDYIAVVTSGIVSTGLSGLTRGALLYVSETAAEVTETAPVTSNAVVRKLGYATGSATLSFSPSMEYTVNP